jgi:hypothetical protein
MRWCNNPAIQGFIAKHICISGIAKEGLKVISALGPMSMMTFDKVTIWQEFLKQSHTHHLFVSNNFNFKAVDCAILHVDCMMKVAKIFPIQITLSSRERDSDHIFYMKTWVEWAQPETTR